MEKVGRNIGSLFLLHNTSKIHFRVKIAKVRSQGLIFDNNDKNSTKKTTFMRMRRSNTNN